MDAPGKKNHLYSRIFTENQFGCESARRPNVSPTGYNISGSKLSNYYYLRGILLVSIAIKSERLYIVSYTNVKLSLKVYSTYSTKNKLYRGVGRP